MKTEIFIAVRRGVVQDVRVLDVVEVLGAVGYECFVVDYDDYEVGGGTSSSEEEFERERLNGRTWEEIEKISKAVY